MENTQKILVFVDFDDTLVVSAINFWKNYADFLVYVYEKLKACKGDNPNTYTPTIQEAITILERFEAQHLPEMGYTSIRMERTFEKVFSSFELLIDDETKLDFSRFAQAPFIEPLTLNEEIEQAIEKLSQEAKIIIWTRGSTDVQTTRVLSVGLDKYISGIWAFSDKSAENLKRVAKEELKELDYSDEQNVEVWMVGNSIEHDILPATQLGINAVLIGGKAGSSNFFRTFNIADSFSQAVDFILGKAVGTRSRERKTLASMFK